MVPTTCRRVTFPATCVFGKKNQTSMARSINSQDKPRSLPLIWAGPGTLASSRRRHPPAPPPPEAIPSCAEAGVLGVVPGLIGIIQAMEAIKLIIGTGDNLLGRLLHVDTLTLRFREFNIRRDPNCPVCGQSPSITEPI